MKLMRTVVAAASMFISIAASAATSRLVETKVPDSINGKQRRVWIYTPANYSAAKDHASKLLLVFDGDTYTTDIPLPKMLDELTAAGKIPPVVAVLIDNSASRLDDLANHRRYADFLAKELVPWVRSKYNVSAKASDVIVAGSSAGGLASSYVARQYPDIFGNVFSQSGAYWRDNEGSNEGTEWLTTEYARLPKAPLRFYVEVGALETGKTAGGPIFIEANRRFVETLRKKGYDVTYVEVPGARHEPGHWGAAFPAGLIHLTH